MTTRLKTFLALCVLLCAQNAFADAVRFVVEPKFFYNAAAFLGGGGGMPTQVVYRAETVGEAFSVAAQLYHSTSCQTHEDGTTFCRSSGPLQPSTGVVNGRVASYRSEGIPDLGSSRAEAVFVSLDHECPSIVRHGRSIPVDRGTKHDADGSMQVWCEFSLPNEDSCDDCGALGNPVLPSTGQKIQPELDYLAGKHGLVFERVYRSTEGQFLSTLNQGWYGEVSDQGSPCYPAYWWKDGQQTEHCHRVLNTPHIWKTGRGRFAMYEGGPASLQARTLGEYAFVQGLGGQGYVRSRDNFLYTLDEKGRVVRKTAADGSTQVSYVHGTSESPSSYATLSGAVLQAQDRFGRTLAFTYDGANQLVSMVDPDGQVYRYEYAGAQLLARVLYPDGTARSYHYEAGSGGGSGGCAAPNAASLLTGITDEAGQRFATYAYDCEGRAVSSEHAGGAYKYTFSYYYAGRPGETTVTDPLGVRRKYNFEKLSERYWPSQVVIDSPVDPSVAASQAFWRDSQGRVLQQSDSGRFTCFTYDTARGLKTSVVQGLPWNWSCSMLAADQPYGFPGGARKVSTEWHPQWSLPVRVAEPRRLTTYVYHGQPDPAAGGTVARCAPDAAVLPDGSPAAVLCRKTEQATDDADGSQGLAAQPSATGPSRTWSWTYDGDAQVLTATDPAGGITRYAYHGATTVDATRGDLLSVTDAAGQVTRYPRYDRHGNVAEQIEPTGRVTTYKRDARQRVTRITQGDLTVTMAYRPTGQLQSLTQSSGYRVSYGYDAAQRLTGWSDNRGASAAYTLDGMGNLTGERVQDAAGQTVFSFARTINAINLPASETTGGDQSATYGYNPHGDVVSRTNGLNQATAYTFDHLRRLVGERNPANASATLAYDAQDAVVQATDFNGVATGYVRDALGNALQETTPDGGAVTTSYDALGLPQAITDALGRASHIARDSLGRPTQIVSSSSSAAGTTAAGTSSRTTVLRYDLPGPDYNAEGAPQASVGHLSEIQDPEVTTRYQRDLLGRVTRKVEILANGDTRTLGYRYAEAGSAGAGQIAAITYPSGRQVQYQYDATGQLTGLTWDGQPLLANLAWNPLGQPTAWQWSGFGPNQAEQRSYTTAGQLAASRLLPALAWDGAGRVTRIQQRHALPGTSGSSSGTDAQQATLTSAFTYDAVGRLTASAHSAPAGLALPLGWGLGDTLGATASGYAWDANGNRTQVHHTSATGAGSDTLERIYTLATGSNRLQGYAETFTPAGSAAQVTQVAYSQDATGALTKKGDTFLHYGVEGRITAASASSDPAGALAVSYTTNALGQRVFKRDARLSGSSTPAITQQTVYAEDAIGSTVLGQYGNRRSSDSAAPAGEMDSTEVIWLPTATGPLPVAAQINGRLYAIDADHLNTPRRLTNAQGQVVWQWLITGFGEANPTTGATGYAQSGQAGIRSYGEAVRFDLRYPGQVWDEETGLNYNLHRYYDAASGRYIQADPIGLEGGWNRFGYVGADPLNFSDDEGLQRRSAVPPVSYAQSLLNAQGVNLTSQIRQYQPNYAPMYV
ncbi:RHS repeat-associated core domain-containing protein, partial [Paracidovorax konjaci]